MNLKNNYYYFKKALPKRFCDEVVRYGKEKNDRIGTVGDYEADTITKKQIKDLKKKRDSNVSFVADPWIHREILPFVHEANKKAGWNFKIDGNESFQFTKYKKGQFYGWHCDSFLEPFSNHVMPWLNGKVRKLSVTVSLSDPSEYEGGELQFDYRNGGDKNVSNIVTCKEIKEKGSLVVFPSFVWHRVKPVKKGVRYSLVIWHCGLPFA
jgi:PKHD-type hydroxylase|tara:strand:+ start:392 stop:1018 length:627 start_codon:yes stop_codon:yes gene_type:complete